MGSLIYTSGRETSKDCLRNLTLAFPDTASQRNYRSLPESVFRNLGRVMAEFTFIPRFDRQTVERYVSFEGTENFYRAEKEGKGVLFLTAHFGNWEWMAASFPLLHEQVLSRCRPAPG